MTTTGRDDREFCERHQVELKPSGCGEVGCLECWLKRMAPFPAAKFPAVELWFDPVNHVYQALPVKEVLRRRAEKERSDGQDDG